jgi:hypothetical protein
MRARIAARARWSKEDPKPALARVRDGNLEKYRREILAEQPDVAEPELSRRADCRMREHMTRIAFERSKARNRTAEGVVPAAGDAS